MRQSIMDHTNKLIRFFGLGALVCLGVWYEPAQALSDQSTASHRLQGLPQWKLHESAAQTALRQAAECLSKTLQSGRQGCDPVQLLNKAGEEYVRLESLISGKVDHAGEAASVASGLLRSGLPVRAITFLLSRPETTTDPVLSHLLADSLFAIGDLPNAARAYGNWIKTGCHGYLYSMNDTDYWLVSSKDNLCAQLPEALRSRLEMLQDATNGEPSNLPVRNDPAAIFPRRLH